MFCPEGPHFPVKLLHLSIVNCWWSEFRSTLLGLFSPGFLSLCFQCLALSRQLTHLSIRSHITIMSTEIEQQASALMDALKKSESHDYGKPFVPQSRTGQDALVKWQQRERALPEQESHGKGRKEAGQARKEN